MSKQRNALKAGIFIVISIALIFMIVVAISGSSGLFQPMRTLKVTFSLKDDVGGLREGDDVRIGGFKVGSVSGIELGTRPAGQSHAVEPVVIVTISLPAKYELRRDAVVSIQSTLTGQSWLNFEQIGTAAPLADGEELAGLPSGLTLAMNTLRSAAPKVDQTLSDVQAAVADVRGKTVPLVNQTIANYSKTADSFTMTANTATKLIEEVRGYLKPVIDKYNVVADSTSKMMDEVRDVFGGTKTDFRQTVANLKDATGTVKDKLPGIMDKVDGIMLKVDTAVVHASMALEDAKKTLEAAKMVLAGNKSKLDGMIASLKATSDNLKGASAEIRRAPWRLLYKPGPGEMSNLNLFDSARQFAEGANDLDNAAEALRDALKQDRPDQEQIQKLMTQLQEKFEKFKEVERKLWEGVR